MLVYITLFMIFKQLDGSNLRSLLSGWVEGISHCLSPCSLDTPSYKLVINGLLHKDTGTSSAALTVIEENTLMGLFDCQLN